jgi:hypothetical protein
MLPGRRARERLCVALLGPLWIPRQRGRGFDIVLFYRWYPERVGLSALSRDQLSPAPAGLRCVGVIPNPLYSPHRAISAVSGVGWPWCWPDRFIPASNLR